MQIKVTKCIKNALFFGKIWSYQKKAVPLHAFSARRKWLTTISLLRNSCSRRTSSSPQELEILGDPKREKGL